ncbi:zinc finger protein-like protein zpr1 [Dothidotthia symphoricarpi CBS 119687]|uniref:Zinc finger protein-like protein zpr1 n=1 Tax=Dothidotthia symphoricarpi CBS 119687 TaxID=1392245 RepID=A0A6A6AID3_9PLEO|nr:zinc finger protein-like protein zpr1 [Dothidotthia symphoricarpi CBS 119687]KAF2131570.1 zinc finger protein-like protein zpr1 [Dothidotthia symphoricarpi CBS 119687]
MAQHQGLAKDLFEDMGRKVAEASAQEGDDTDTKVVDEIESLCMNCHENGTTRLLLTKIPFFREIVIMSFACPHCNLKNAEIQSAGEIQQRGVKFSMKVETAEDLNRQIIKSDTAIFRVEDIDLEIPPGRGQLTNVEGILAMVAQDLEQKQDERKEVMPEVYEKLQGVIDTIKQMSNGEKLPFKLTIDDPAGNSSIEPPTVLSAGKYSRHEYPRTAAQNEALGLGDSSGEAPDTDIRPEYHASQMYPEMPASAPMVNNVDEDDIVENQVYSFPATCPGCTKSCTTNMKMVNIPHFKQVILMSTVCDHCGYRSNEVKTGGEVPEKGRRITVNVNTKEDLSRDILKAESCAMSCPELNLSVEPGTLGGRFTTVEGLLTQVRDDLRSSIFDVGDGGDSMNATSKDKWGSFFEQLTEAINGNVKFTIILEDPLASSYVQSFTAPEPDPQIKVEEYNRTAEEEEELGLTDMKTEGYEEEDAATKAASTDGA